METALESKAPADTTRYEWEPRLTRNDVITAASVVVASGTVAVSGTETDSNAVVFFVAGGAAGETARLTASATTFEGETITETLLLPVRSSDTILNNTASDVCNFALRKIVGNNASASASELEDALERLNDMIAMWRIQSLDIGITKKLVASDTLAIPDAFIMALKFCLRLDLHEFYDVPLSALDSRQALEAQAAVLAKTIQMQDLTFDRELLRRQSGWDFTRGY